MKLFSPLYCRATVWARHPRAPWYLGGMAEWATHLNEDDGEAGANG